MGSLLPFCGVIIILVQSLTESASKNYTDKIERFINVKSDKYVTVSLPDLAFSQRSSIRLGTWVSRKIESTIRFLFGLFKTL